VISKLRQNTCIIVIMLISDLLLNYLTHIPYVTDMWWQIIKFQESVADHQISPGKSDAWEKKRDACVASDSQRQRR
jgi:hypothetical protein